MSILDISKQLRKIANSDEVPHLNIDHLISWVTKHIPPEEVRDALEKIVKVFESDPEHWVKRTYSDMYHSGDEPLSEEFIRKNPLKQRF